MIEQLLNIALASVICLILFTGLDFIFGLPKKSGVSGGGVIASEIEKSGGDIAGGRMLGNIITSPDASAGVLLASCGYFVWGVFGSLICAALVFVGARICADKGFAGTSGALCATLVIWLATTFASFAPEHFIAGTVIAILLVEGISHKHATKLIGKIWRRCTWLSK